MSPRGWRKELSGTSPDSPAGGSGLREGAGMRGPRAHERELMPVCCKDEQEPPQSHDTAGCGVLPSPLMVYLQAD